MSQLRGVETLLFWIMALAGFAGLAPCIVLPPWLEYEAQLQRRRATEAYVAALHVRLDAIHRQIEHLDGDPGYVLRLAREEFGNSIRVPGVETVRIEPSPEEPDTALATVEDPNTAESLVPELSAFVDEAMNRYSYAWLFVNGNTRPILIGLSFALLLTAVVLLGRAGVRE